MNTVATKQPKIVPSPLKPSPNKQTNTQELLELIRLQNVQLKRSVAMQDALLRAQEIANKRLRSITSNTTIIALLLLAPIIIAGLIFAWIAGGIAGPLP